MQPQFIVFTTGKEKSGDNGFTQTKKIEKPLYNDWNFSTVATRDNAWGEMRWEPSIEPIGPEVRQFFLSRRRNESKTEWNWVGTNQDL